MFTYLDAPEEVAELLFVGCKKSNVNVVALLKKYWKSDTNGRRVIPIASLESAIKRAISKTNDETLGFLERPTLPGSIMMSLLIAISGRNLKGAINLNLRYWSYIHYDLSTRLVIKGTKAKIMFELKSEKVHESEKVIFYVLLGLFFLKWISWAIGKTVPPIDFTLKVKPNSFAKDLEFVFSSGIQYEASQNSISFDVKHLSSPLYVNQENVKEFVFALPQIITANRISASTKSQVKNFLRSDMEFRPMKLGEIANHLSMAPDTLRQKLRAEGTSYTKIKDELRQEVAIHLIANSTMSIGDVAHLTGYSESSAFIRSFRKWTELSPSEYRKKYFTC